jgi:hypothetical protein
MNTAEVKGPSQRPKGPSRRNPDELYASRKEKRRQMAGRGLGGRVGSEPSCAAVTTHTRTPCRGLER